MDDAVTISREDYEELLEDQEVLYYIAEILADKSDDES